MPRPRPTAIAATRSYESARLRVRLSGARPRRVRVAAVASPPLLLAALLARRGASRGRMGRWESGLARGLFDDLIGPPQPAPHRRPAPPARRPGRPAQPPRQPDRRPGRRRALTDEQRGRLDGAEGPPSRAARPAGPARGGAGPGVSGGRRRRLLPRRDPGPAAGRRCAGRLARSAGDARRRAIPGGDHWACVVRSRGAPRWVRIAGTGAGRAWTEDDDQRPARSGGSCAATIGPPGGRPRPTLAAQRLDPLGPRLAPAMVCRRSRHLIVLPSPSLAGIPVEAMLEARPAPPRYRELCPSGTSFAWLRERRARATAARPRLLAWAIRCLRPPTGRLRPPVRPAGPAGRPGRTPSGPASAGRRVLRYAGARWRPDDLRSASRPATRGRGRRGSVWRGQSSTGPRPGPLGVALNDRPAAEASCPRGRCLLRRTAARPSLACPAPHTRSGPSPDSSAEPRSTSAPTPASRPSRRLRARDELAAFAVIHLADPRARSTTCRR